MGRSARKQAGPGAQRPQTTTERRTPPGRGIMATQMRLRRFAWRSKHQLSSAPTLPQERSVAMPTALELTRDEWQQYLQAAPTAAMPLVPGTAELRLRERLLSDARQAAAELKRRFAVSRVLLFGSLTDEVWFTNDSDVDLAVEGLAPHDYWAAWRTVEEIITDREVDLVDLDAASSTLQQAIKRYGLEL
jgi:predicted nucleotidyltransferase